MPTPAVPSTQAQTCQPRIAVRSSSAESSSTKTGWTEPTSAADPAGQVVGGDEEEVEEDPDVQGPQHQDPPPPVTLRKLPPRQREDQPARQRAYGGGEERAVRRQELGGHEIGAAPDDGGEDGERGVESDTLFHEAAAGTVPKNLSPKSPMPGTMNAFSFIPSSTAEVTTFTSGAARLKRSSRWGRPGS